MTLADAIRARFPEGDFRPPAAATVIRSAHEELRVALPPDLRDVYAAFDGFREPVGNAACLLPLIDDTGAGSLVATTLFY